MNKNLLQKRVIFLSTILAVAMAFYLYFFYMVIRTGERSNDLYISLNHYESSKEQFHDVEELIKETEADRVLLDATFYSSSRAVNFIEKIESLGKQSGVRLTTTSITATKDGKLEMSFVAIGEFRGVYTLLALLESLPSEVAIKSAGFQKNSGTESPASPSTWTANFTISLLSFIP